MKTLKNQITDKLTINQEKYKKNFDLIKEEFQSMKTDLTKRIEVVEKKQKMHLETVNYIKNYDQDKIGDDYLGETYQPVLYKKPTKNEMKQLLEEIEKGGITKKKTKNFVVEPVDEDIDEFLTHRRRVNEDIDVQDKFNELILDKKQKAKNIFEKLRIEKLQQSQESAKKIAKFAVKFKKTKKLKAINKFRAMVLAMMMIKKLKLLFRQNSYKLKIDSLEYFKANYNSVEKMINHLIYMSIKDIYSNILVSTFEIHLNDNEKNINSFSRKAEVDNRFIKLEARLKSIFEKLIEGTNKISINPNIINFFQVILTEGTCIPFNYFSFFERARIEYSENLTLKNMTVDHQKMVICFNVLLKGLVKSILIDNNVPNKKNISNVVIQKNLKMIGTIIYRTVVDYFMEKLTPQFISSNNKIFQKLESIEYEEYENQSFDMGQFDTSDPTSHDKYNEIAKKMYERDKKDNTNYRNVNMFFEASNDDSENEVEFILKDLYRKNEIRVYYKFANLNSFNLTGLMEKWLDKFYGLIFPNAE